MITSLQRTIVTIFILTVLIGVGFSPVLASPSTHGVACEGSEYIVKRGDILAQIAKRHYGKANAYPRIVRATRTARRSDRSFAWIKHPNLIVVGSKLCLPNTKLTAKPIAEPDKNSPKMKTVTIRFDLPLAPNTPVAIFAEVPGTLAGPRNHIMLEGNGSEPLSMDLPPGEYLFYGYRASSTLLDMEYFGAWAINGGLDLIDVATVDQVILSRPANPCNPIVQLNWPSPDRGRFPATDSPERLGHLGCSDDASTGLKTIAIQFDLPLAPNTPLAIYSEVTGTLAGLEVTSEHLYIGMKNGDIAIAPTSAADS